MSELDLKKLSKKFNEEDIEWRVQQCGQGKNGPWALIIPYITNRAIMQRLDESVGPASWKNEFTSSPCGKGYLCGISIKIDGEWVTRWDGAEISESDNIDDVKSTLSSSMKRTGVQWGIGRYLYQFEAMFADCLVCDNRYELKDGYNYQNSKDKKSNSWFGFQWRPKPLEEWALPVTEKDVVKFIKLIEKTENLNELRFAFQIAYKAATSENDNSMMDRFIKAKEEVKSKFESNEVEEVQEKNQILAKTIGKHIGIINCANNPSSVKGLSEGAIEEVKKMTRGKQLIEAIKEIKSASKLVIDNLKKKS